MSQPFPPAQFKSKNGIEVISGGDRGAPNAYGSSSCEFIFRDCVRPGRCDSGWLRAVTHLAHATFRLVISFKSHYLVGVVYLFSLSIYLSKYR